MRDQVTQWLSEWFSSRAGSASPDVNYFDAGWLTSAEVVEFVTEIEERFGIQFTDADFSDERFVSIAGLSELIAQHLPEDAVGRAATGT